MYWRMLYPEVLIHANVMQAMCLAHLKAKSESDMKSLLRRVIFLGKELDSLKSVSVLCECGCSEKAM